MPLEHVQSTRWSLVRRAKGRTPESRQALSELCKAYYYPCYAFLRSRVRDANKAQELTQGFFSDLLGKNRLAKVEEEQGRFRDWLQQSLRNYQINDWDREKRSPLIQVDAAEVERRFGQEPSTDPDTLMERAWALTVIERALEALDAEEEDGLPREIMEKLRGEGGNRTYGQIAEALGKTPGAIKQASHRLQAQWADIVWDVVADTIDSDDVEEIDREIRYLLSLWI